MISYASPDRRRAEALKEFLVTRCTVTRPEDVRVVEREAGPAEDIGKRVMDEIERCDVFVSLYTEAGRMHPGPWLNQEVGYAFRLMREGRLVIIPVWEGSRPDVERGFLASASVHIDSRFRLSGKDAETFDNVARYLEEEYVPPFAISWSWQGEGGGPYLRLRIETRTSKPTTDVSVNFVFPSLWNTSLSDHRIVPPQAVTGPTKSLDLPEALRDRFEITGGCKRFTWNLERLAGLEAHEMRFVIHPPRQNESQALGRLNLLFGSYVAVPVFGLRRFQMKADCQWVVGGYKDFQGEVTELRPDEKALVRSEPSG